MRFLSRFTVIAFAIAAVSTFAANTLSTGGHNGMVRVQNADVLGLGGFMIGGAAEYSQEGEYLHSVTPNEKRDGSPRFVSGVGYFGVGVAPVLDLAINLPAYYDRPNFGPRNSKGVGDLEFSLKLAGLLLKGDESPVTSAYYCSVQFPTGNPSEGFFPRHAYYGSEGNWSAQEALFHPMIMMSFHFDRIKNAFPMGLHFNLGGVFNAPEDNHAVTAAMGFDIFPAEWLTFFTELSMEERFVTVNKEHPFSDMVNDPIFVTPGIKFTIPNVGLFFTLAGDFGISEYDKEFAQISHTETGHTISHQANMLYNAYFNMGWQKPSGPKDSDKDGVLDDVDKCPTEFGIAENNGCPDKDADNDGIVDRLDKCINEAEDNDDFQDDDGCPDPDNDNDGIADAADRCPNESGVAENKGCPDKDTDSDGIVDRLDKCSNEPEDKDGYQDDDGCPEYDNDGDGIPDSLDKCPGNPGPQETQGCPKTQEIRGQLVLKGVNFESGKATLLGGSFKVLDETAESLREWPEVKIEIQGHTDNTGSAARNQELSQQRAQTVRQYLIDKGTAPNRLTAVGYGPNRPIADNKSRNGRAQNRRVEISRTN
ncbi:MAG: OmpA family protein [Chitinispirillaceae bacterium]|nr:OmpA family protein [Chitinispirillaceae bacterium]